MKLEGLVVESGRHKWQKLDCAKETRRSQGMKVDGLMEWNPFHPFEPFTLDRIMKSFKKLFAKIFAQQFFLVNFFYHQTISFSDDPENWIFSRKGASQAFWYFLLKTVLLYHHWDFVPF